MQIANFSNARVLNTPRPQVKQKVAFTATLAEVKDAAEKSTKLCPGKKGFINQIIQFFENIQAQLAKKDDSYPKKFDFKLGEENTLPEKVMNMKAFDTTVGDIDKKMNEGRFSCGTDSKCSCGKGQSLGEFFSKVILGKILKVNKPEVLEIDATK